MTAALTNLFLAFNGVVVLLCVSLLPHEDEGSMEFVQWVPEK